MQEKIMKYSIVVEVDKSMVDEKGRATNGAILKLLEDVSTAHAESVGYGLEALRSRGVTWMLVDWRVEVTRRPVSGESVVAVTWSRGAAARVFALRDFELFVDGELVAKASSRWIIYDFVNSRLTKVTDETIEKYAHEKALKAFPDGGFEKIAAFDDYDKTVPYSIKPGDIDKNGHLHNLVYLDIASDEVGQKVFDNFSISYKKEILPSDNVLCKVKFAENATCFSIENKDTHAINALIKMS